MTPAVGVDLEKALGEEALLQPIRDAADACRLSLECPLDETQEGEGEGGLPVASLGAAMGRAAMGESLGVAGGSSSELGVSSELGDGTCGSSEQLEQVVEACSLRCYRHVTVL